MPQSYLHELSAKEKKQFYSEEFLEGYSLMKLKLFVVGIVIVIGDIIFNWIPSPFLTRSTGSSVTNFLAPIAFLIYMFSYSSCLQKRGNKYIRARLIINAIAMLIFSGQCAFATYYRTSQALQTGLQRDWIAAQLLFVMSIHVIPLIALLTPVWYLKVVVGGSYYLGLAVAYAEAHYVLTWWIIARVCVSFVFLSALGYLAWFFKYKYFVQRIDAEAWNKVYKDVLERSQGCVAIISTDGKVTYSNSEFKRVTEEDPKSFFKKFTKLKIRNWTETLTEKTFLNALDSQYGPEDDGRLQPGQSLNIKGSISEFRDLDTLLNQYKKFLENNEVQAKDQVIFNGKIESESNINLRTSYEGIIRPLVEYKKLVLIFFDVTEREQIVVLEHTNEYKDKLLASISHELRTPLNGNLGFLQAAINDSAIPTASKASLLMPALRSGKLLSHLIDDILDYSLLQTSKLLLNFESKSLKETLAYCYELFNHAFSVKNLTFSLELDEKVPVLLKTDHNRVIQIVLNLLSNALKFTIKGSVTVQVSCFGESHAEIKVKDTGVGISQENIDKLFEETMTPDNSSNEQRNRYSQGAGLGLKVANSLAKLLGFDPDVGLEVQSVLKEGSTFSFKIRNVSVIEETHSIEKESLIVTKKEDIVLFHSSTDLTPSGGRDIPSEGDEEGFEKRNTSSYFKMKKTLSLLKCPSSQRYSLTRPRIPSAHIKRILIVDDDPFNILALRSLFGQLGAVTDSANNGKQAVDKIIKNPSEYQLIFMDCQMPVMNGYEAAHLLTELMHEGKLPEIPIIGCTAFSAKDKIEECKRCGMKEVMNKPVMVDRLREIYLKYSTEFNIQS